MVVPPKGNDHHGAKKRDRDDKSDDDSEEGETEQDAAEDDRKERSPKEDSKQPAKRSRLDRMQLDDKAKRGRSRLLGGLLTGTLNRVKRDIDKGPTKHEAAKAEVMERIREKERAARENAREDRIRQKREERETELRERNRLARAQAEKEFELLTIKWSNHRELQKKFILTKTEPRIFWSPAEHTDTTTSLLESMPMMLAERSATYREAAEKDFQEEQAKYAALGKKKADNDDDEKKQKTYCNATT